MVSTSIAPLRSEDIDAAERAAETLRQYWKKQGKDINVRVGVGGQIVSDFSSQKAKHFPPTNLQPAKPRTCIRETLRAFLASYQGRWFTAAVICKRIACTDDSLTLALIQLRKEDAIRTRTIPRYKLRGPRKEYSIKPKG